MADVTSNNSEVSKKSGFSFRKKRSNSKTRKEDNAKPVDTETVNNDEEIIIACSGEGSANKDEVPATATSDVEAVSCGEESSIVKPDEEQSPESAEQTKKKTKRRSRSLFKSRKRSKVEKSVERNDEAVKDVKNEEVTPEATTCSAEVKAPVYSDVEYGGEASETDGELARDDDDDDEDDGAKTSGNETSDETKKVNKTKKKSFFKRGLSLRRSKGKKKTNNEEQKDDTNTTNHQENPPPTTSDNQEEQPPTTSDNHEKPPTTILKPESVSFATQTTAEKNDDCKDVTSECSAEKCEEKKAPIKPVRKVSFAQKSYESSDGESPAATEEKSETQKDAQDAPVETNVLATETAATETEEVPTETEGAPIPTDVDDDDDLTEVSSVTSSVVISVLDIEEPAEQTGSRITLEESGEVGEGSGEQEVVAEPEVEITSSAEKVPEESEEEKPLEEEPLLEDSTEESFKDAQTEKSTLEDDKLLSDETTKTKDADWLLQQSCDMSHEISRVRKQTLFSVKRLCCSVM